MEDSPSACRLPDRVTRAQIRAAIRHPVVACSRKTRPDNCPVKVLNASLCVPGVDRPAGQGDMRGGGPARAAPHEY